MKTSSRSLLLALMGCGPGLVLAQEFKAGVGRADISPREPVWLGGYEADFNLIYYGLRARFAPTVEDTLVKAVLDAMKRAAVQGEKK